MAEKRETPEEFGARLRKLREERGWTARRLAEAIGVGEATVCQWERGVIRKLTERNRLTLERWMADATALDPGHEERIITAKVSALEAQVARHDKRLDDLEGWCDSVRKALWSGRRGKGAA